MCTRICAPQIRFPLYPHTQRERCSHGKMFIKLCIFEVFRGTPNDLLRNPRVPGNPGWEPLPYPLPMQRSASTQHVRTTMPPTPHGPRHARLDKSHPTNHWIVANDITQINWRKRSNKMWLFITIGMQNTQQD